MELDRLIHDLLGQGIVDPARIAVLRPDQVIAVVDALHAEVERHFYINANRSLEIADLIEQIGNIRNDPRTAALGLMKRADSLRFLGQLHAAWQAFDEAGTMMMEAGDNVGWARTRIGRLVVSVDVNRVEEALADAERARAVFVRHERIDRLLVLDNNLGIVFRQLGNYARALECYRAALAIAESRGEAGQPMLARLHTNIGNVYDLLGDFRAAVTHHERARALFADRGEASGVAQAESNAAHAYMAQGQYQRALRLMHSAARLYEENQLPLGAAFVERDITECYLLLNRYEEARDLAQQVSRAFEKLGSAYEQALSLLHLATAEAELHNDAAAHAALDRAAAIFEALDVLSWVGTVHFYRGRLAFRAGDLQSAEYGAREAACYFEKTGQQVQLASTMLLQGQIALVHNNLAEAARAGRAAQVIAQRSKVPPLRYATHLFLGKLAESRGDQRRAVRQYSAAVAVVERVQRRLTITLRPGFLGDKEEALRALMALRLEVGEPERAFETLERAKSQVLLNYLVNRQQLQWRAHDPRSQALLADLAQLRAQHQQLYGLASGSATSHDSPPRTMSLEQAGAELIQCERRMRMITEHLYLHAGDQAPLHLVAPPSIREIQSQLDNETLLVEYYIDAAGMAVFTLDADSFTVHRSSPAGRPLDKLVAQLQINLNAALRAGPLSAASANLSGLAQHLLQSLYESLLAPIAQRLAGKQRLIIVPYGILHYVPMHLLHTGSHYLIEQAEVVILPAAGLITRPGPVQVGGAHVLAHSWDDRLPHTLREAKVVHELFGGQLWHDGAARRSSLHVPATKILHIAAHAAYRLDIPDLSYIELADGQTYADDLMQEDMSYELVTLSACETGRAGVAPGDELIGLGRGFLYAGAGALIASLWPVADEVTVDLMERTYRALCAGASKAAALREAQLAVKSSAARLHPAFWGAFQLVGNPKPLSDDSMERGM